MAASLACSLRLQFACSILEAWLGRSTYRRHPHRFMASAPRALMMRLVRAWTFGERKLCSQHLRPNSARFFVSRDKPWRLGKPTFPPCGELTSRVLPTWPIDLPEHSAPNVSRRSPAAPFPFSQARPLWRRSPKPMVPPVCSKVSIASRLTFLRLNADVRARLAWRAPLSRLRSVLGRRLRYQLLARKGRPMERPVFEDISGVRRALSQCDDRCRARERSTARLDCVPSRPRRPAAGATARSPGIRRE